MLSKTNHMKQNICTQIKNHNRYNTLEGNTLKGIRLDKYNVVLTIAIYLPEKKRGTRSGTRKEIRDAWQSYR